MPRPSPIAAAYPIAPGKRLQPPDDFAKGSPEYAFFLQTVTSVPADHFQQCDMGDLVVYVGAYVDLMVARGELKASGNIVDGKVNPLAALVRDSGRTVNMLARSLRLSPISRVPLPIKQEAPNLSYYQRQALQDQHDDPAN